MAYIDGVIVPVKHAQAEAYREMARMAAPIFLEHGALQVIESWGEGVPHGKQTDFHRAVAAEPDENIVFSLVVWPSRAARDAGNAAAQEDPRFAGMMDQQVFDGKRMIFGGFEQILDTREA